MKNIFLIGFMGCGKSTVAECLTKKYGMETIEMDQIIVEREKMSVSDIFASKGEPYFRDLETSILVEIQGQENKVVSCGGGVALRDRNVLEMKKNGIIVFLTARPETILERVKDDEQRPLLRGYKNIGVIQNMLEQRRTKYEKAADMMIQTDDKDVEAICKEILDKIEGV